MDHESFFKMHETFCALSDRHKSIVLNVYDKFKDSDCVTNADLSRYILMFVSAGAFYKGRAFDVNVDSLTREKINAIIKCCVRTLPERGTFYGIQMCQMYNMPRQQNNLNVKKPKKTDGDTSTGAGDDSTDINGGGYVAFDDAEEWIRRECSDPLNRQIYSSAVFKDCVENFHAKDKNDLFLSMSQPKVIYTSLMVTTTASKMDPGAAYADIVRRCIRYCMCIELKKMSDDAITFVVYHVNKSFFEKFVCSLYHMFGPDSIVMWFTNERTLLTKKYGGDYFLRNYVDFLYCFMTNRFEPDTPSTLNDIVTMMICKLIAGIIKAIKFESLKSTGLYRAGYTPMSLITTEASLLNIRKLVNESASGSGFPTTYSVYTPSESMFVNTAVTRDNIVIKSNYE